MVNSTPLVPDELEPYYSRRDDSTKNADPQFFVVADPASTVEDMENAIWQNIGGHEIISLARRDLVDGINLDYTLINNLKELQQEYNPKTIFAIEDVATTTFKRFGLSFANFLPTVEELEAIQEGLSSPVVLDDSGNIVIYVKNIRDDQEVEAQIISSEELLRDTIYGEQL